MGSRSVHDCLAALLTEQLHLWAGSHWVGGSWWILDLGMLKEAMACWWCLVRAAHFGKRNMQQW